MKKKTVLQNKRQLRLCDTLIQHVNIREKKVKVLLGEY